eukprot:47786_1
MAGSQNEHLLSDGNNEQEASIQHTSHTEDDNGDNAAYASLGSYKQLPQPQRLNVSTSHPNLNPGNIQQIPESLPKPLQPIQSVADSSVSDNLLILGTPTKPSTYAPWTPRGASLYLQDKFQAGSIKGSIFTLIICIVGAGALSLPWAFRVSGLLLGTFLLLVASGFTFLSLHFLVYAGLYIKERPSYRNLAKKAGGKWLAAYTSVNLLCNLFGTTVSYTVACGGILDLVYSVVTNSKHSIYQELVYGVAAFIVFPLSLMRSISFLRYGSLIGITCSAYLCLVIIINYFRLCDDQSVFEGEHIQRHTCFWKSNFSLTSDDLFKLTPNGFLSSFPIFVYAYSCQPQVLPIYVELQRRSVRRMHKVIRRSLYFSVTLYVSVGIFGFLTFMDGSCGNVLQNNFKKHPEVILSAVTICISCMFTLPICVYAFRENITVITVGKVKVHWIPHTLITLIMVFVCATIAAEVSQLNVVLGFLGSTTNPSVAFFLPNYYFMKLVPYKKAPKRYWVALISMVVLLTLSAASFVFQIYALFDTSLNPATDCASAQSIKG